MLLKAQETVLREGLYQAVEQDLNTAPPLCTHSSFVQGVGPRGWRGCQLWRGSPRDPDHFIVLGRRGSLLSVSSSATFPLEGEPVLIITLKQMKQKP